MPTNTTAYDIGDMISLHTIVKTTAGATVNTGMTFKIKTPAGVITTYGPVTLTNSTVIVNVSSGTWKKNYLITGTSYGRYTYQWKSTGAVNLSTGGAFAVRPRYAT